MTIPHRDDPAGVPARGPDQHHEPAAQVARGDQAGFTVIASAILARCVQAGEHLRRIGEVEPSLRQGLGPLGRVEGDAHAFSVVPNIRCRNPGLTPSTREAARRIGITETALRKAASAGRIAREPDGRWDIDKTRRLAETADPSRSPLAGSANAAATPFARLKVAQLALKVEAQRLASIGRPRPTGGKPQNNTPGSQVASAGKAMTMPIAASCSATKGTTPR
jgi:uncharacterized membrane protein YccC